MRRGFLMDPEFWQTADGRVLRIQDMEESHARNVKNMLLRNATGYAFRAASRALIDAAMHDGGDMAQDALDQIADELLEAAYDHKKAVDWIKVHPTFKALKRRLRRKS